MDWIINEYETIKLTKSNNMKAADCSFDVSMFLKLKRMERKWPSAGISEVPVLADLLENFTVIEDENTDGFEEYEIENFEVHVSK